MDNEQLKPLLESVLAGLKAGGDFALAQAPLLAKELVWWGVGTAIFWGVFWTVVALVARWRLWPVIDKALRDGGETGLADFLKWVSELATYGLPLVAWAVNGYTLLMIALAPRLYLIKRIGELLAGK